MISKTKIKNRKGNKTNTELVETVNVALKNAAWTKVAQRVSASSRKYSSVNLGEIDAKSKAGDTIVIIGKVLGNGELNKKVRVCALSFSASALTKMKESKSEAVSLLEEINKNPKAAGIKVLP